MRKALSVILIISMFVSTLNFVYSDIGSGRVIDIIDKGGFAFAQFSTTATAGSGTKFVTHGWNIGWGNYINSDPNNIVRQYNFLYIVTPDTSLTIDYSIPLIDGASVSTKSVEQAIRKTGNTSLLNSWLNYVSNDGVLTFQAYIRVWKNGVDTGKSAQDLQTALSLENWGANTVSEFQTEYYNRNAPFSKQSVSVKPTAQFTINYNNSNITGNQSNPLLKSASRTLVLQDESVAGSTSDPITGRTWYYWDVANGYKPLAGKSGVTISGDGTQVTISDYDANLSGSSATSKGFKLIIQTQSGATDYAERTSYFQYGSITASYKDVDTNAVLYTDVTTSNLLAGTQSITAKTPPAGYTLLTPSPQSVTLDQNNPKKAVTFYYKKNIVPLTGTIVVQYKNKKNPTEDVIAPDTLADKPYGAYIITAKPAPGGFIFDPTSTPSPQTVTLDANNRFIVVTFYYVAAGSQGQPPIAVITGPAERMAGESVSFSGSSSIDPDGTIVQYIWDIPGANIIRQESGGKRIFVWYPHEGEYDLFLTVVDNSGMTGECMTSIKIKPPIPTAVIDITGTFKENRKVTINGANSSSPAYYPINKYTWAMTHATDAKYIGTFGTEVTKDMIFKKAQAYRFDLTVQNTYGLTDSESKTLTVVSDVAPTADFTVAAQVLRNPNDSNFATITATNLSKSPDGDTIKKTVMFYAYDSDNDGNFDEETWYISKDGSTWAASGLSYIQLNNLDLYNLSGASNPGSFVLKTKNIGKYKFEAKTIEDIPAADTIPSLLSVSDYKTGITTTLKPLSAKVVEVINTAPTVSFEVKKKKPADIFIFTDYTGTKLDGLQSAITVKKAQLNAINVDANFVIINTSKSVGEQVLKKYKFFRNFFFDVKVTEGSGTNLYISPTSPVYLNEGGLWEETISYDKPFSDIPKNRHYSGYGYVGSTSVRKSNYEYDGANYRVYDTAGGYEDVSVTTWYNNNGFYRDYNTRTITRVGVEDTWTKESLIGTDTFSVTSIDLDQIQTQTLRTGSDRYAFFLSDAVNRDYTSSYGTGFAFGSLTDAIQNYIKQNNFKVSIIAPQTALDVNLVCEKVRDFVATGHFTFYTNVSGQTKSLATLYPRGSGEIVYPYDRGTNFGKIVASESKADYNTYSNYLIMENGTVKKQEGVNDTFTTMPGLTGIIKKQGDFFFRANGEVLNASGVVVATGVTLEGSNPISSFWIEDINDKYWQYNVFIKTDGTLIAVNRENLTQKYVYDEYWTYDSNGYSTGGPYYRVINNAKSYCNGYLLKTNGDLITIGEPYYDEQKARFYYGSYSGPWLTPLATNVGSIKKEENSDMFDITLKDGSKKVGFYERVPIYRRGEFQGFGYNFKITDKGNIVSLYTSKGTSWNTGQVGNFALMSDGNLLYSGVHYEGAYTLDGILNAPVVLSNIKTFDGRVAIANDGKAYYCTLSFGSNYSAPTCYVTALTNIPNIEYTVTKEYEYYYNYSTSKHYITYIMTKDHTLYAIGASHYGQAGIIRPYDVTTPVVANTSPLSLSDPNLKYLTLRDLYNLPGSEYFGTGQYTQALNSLAAKYTSDPSYSTNYVLLGDTVNYNVIYEDYEVDPNYRQYWTHNHESNYFENSLGLASFHGQTLSAPVTTFDKVGKYTINLKVRDNPKNDDKFDNYRLYNQGVVTATLYVHRLGVPVIKPVITANGAYWKVEAQDGGSCDLDHLSRSDKGIVAREWRWKTEYETVWHNERMVKTDCLPTESYQIQLRVKDVEGFWSDWQSTTIQNGNPPVSQFRVDNSLIKLADTLKVLDQSYVQSFSVLSQWHWIVKKLNSNGTVPSTNLQDAKFTNSNNGTGSLAGYDANVKTSYTSNGVGTYRLYLRVKDSSGMWSDGGTDASYTLTNLYTQDINVDTPPTARFTVDSSLLKTTDTLRLKDTSYITGTSPIAKWHWIIKKLSSDGSAPSTSIQDAQFDNSNSGTGTMSGYDVNIKTIFSDTGVGNYRIYLRVMNRNGMWSDGGTDSSYNLNNFFSTGIAVDTPPTAQFTITNNPLNLADLLKIRDTSYITGSSAINRWHWVIKKLNTDGSLPAANLQNAQFSNSNNGIGSLAGYDANVKTNYSSDGAGIYRIYLRVRNSNGMWSDGGTDASFNLNNFYNQDLVTQESFKISNFRVTKVRDLHLESYYKNPGTGKYEDKPMAVSVMAIDAQNFLGMVSSLTKGYLFEFAIDSANFNEDADTIVLEPHFYTCDLFSRDAAERDLYWENSLHEVLKAGEGGHANWATVILTQDNRTITGENSATWRGSYLIPGSAWAVPKGTSGSNAKSADLKRDIIVNFEIKGYKNGIEKFNYNAQQWPIERTVAKHPYEIGDVIRYSWDKSCLEDIKVHINRP